MVLVKSPCSPSVALLLVGALLAFTTATHAASHVKKSVYGAIAYEPTRRAVGYSYDFKSAREAKIEALKQCGEPTCEVLVSFRNACGAVARGPAKTFAATGATRAEAETRALRRCGDGKCAIAAWACTK
jgi:serine/threonine-protein kinase